uniref:Uncharacterized protein n=1 Tax=Arundo donax TaxID=35708 RepID=A0A0A9PXN0_ARUDO
MFFLNLVQDPFEHQLLYNLAPDFFHLLDGFFLILRRFTCLFLAVRFGFQLRLLLSFWFSLVDHFRIFDRVLAYCCCCGPCGFLQGLAVTGPGEHLPQDF